MAARTCATPCYPVDQGPCPIRSSDHRCKPFWSFSRSVASFRMNLCRGDSYPPVPHHSNAASTGLGSPTGCTMIKVCRGESYPPAQHDRKHTSARGTMGRRKRSAASLRALAIMASLALLLSCARNRRISCVPKRARSKMLVQLHCSQYTHLSLASERVTDPVTAVRFQIGALGSPARGAAVTLPC